MWSFGFERDHGDIPRTSPVSRRHAPARHALERFELENGAVGLTELIAAAGTAIRTSLANAPGAADVRRPLLQSRDQLSVRQAIGCFGSFCREIAVKQAVPDDARVVGS